MLVKKLTAVFALLLILTMIMTACGGKTETPTTTTTVPATIIKTLPPTTTTTPPPTTTVAATTIAAVPKVTTGSVTGITIDSASFDSAVDKGYVADRQGFDWGTKSGNYEFNWDEKGDFTGGSFKHQVAGLAGGTTYYYRGKAHNSFGWGYGAEKSFRTLGIPKITGVTANYGLLGNLLEVTINGLDFTNATAVSLGDGITITKYTVSSDTKIIANISIAPNAVTGARTASVTTDIGTGTLANAFTVKQSRQVRHTTVWTDSQFNQILHTLAPTPTSTYSVSFHENSQLTLTTTRAYTLWVELRNGKLCITNVTQSFWDSLWSSGSQYMSFDSAAGVITINALPATVLQTMFDVPVTILPAFTSCNGVAGSVILNYYLTEEVI